jgi:signal transduction histidine kinase
MLRDVISLVSERADEKALEIKTEITDEIPDGVISDEFRIRQILVNLLNNAIKYTDKGKVTLKLGGNYTQEGYVLELAVKDTGKGIRKEDKEHLFEAFSRADVKKNANIEGTGLGLAIVKSIVDSMQGTLGVESEYGIGSEFWVKLPVKYYGNELLGIDFMK